MARIFIGVSWPYANGPQHLGHLASTYVPADIFARYHRLRDDQVLMVTGSDMHGTPILVAAEKAGETPAELADRFHAVNSAALTQLGVSFDVFTTTHTVLHERKVHEVFLALLEGGYIRRRTADAAYCPTDRRFLPDRYLEGTCPHCGFEKARGDECDNCGRPLEPKQLGSPRCAIDGTPAEFRPSEHFYLELDRLQPKLAEYIARQGPHWRPGVLHVAENFLNEGLHPTPITRDLDWGVTIPLEGYGSKRIYVWFEALVGYLSAAQEWAIRAGRPDAWRSYWEEREPVRHYYFVGKDNKFHHTIVWPSMLLGVGGLHLPYDVPANEWMTLGGAKVSKSRTREQDAFLPSLLERYLPDTIRFYAALLAPQNHDTELDWAEFERVHDEILANQYGNLAQRLLVLVRDRYGGVVPTPPEGWSPESSEVGRRLRAAHVAITGELEAVHLKEALELTLTEVREGNRRFHEAKPWASEEAARRQAVTEGLWLLKAAAIWLSPVLQFSSAVLFRSLGYSEGPARGDWESVGQPVNPGQTLGEVRPLFPRLEPRGGATPKSGTPSAGPTPAPGERLPPLEIRAARVIHVENHPSADRLYVLTVEAGESRPRTVVAGLRDSYVPEQLKGRRVALLANLEPRTIRRVTSQGMILAADVGGKAALLEIPEGVEPGQTIGPLGAPARAIAYSEFEATPLLVARADVPSPAGGRSVSAGRPITVDREVPAGASIVVRLASADAPEGSVLAFDDAHLLLAPPTAAPGTRVR
ncbi:MAG TPA: methionine--tRNA ligase [Thermoplasmata archaeon]|nr:methionine--tRNA ligase [Thermoplasmata archaeon]